MSNGNLQKQRGKVIVTFEANTSSNQLSFERPNLWEIYLFIDKKFILVKSNDTYNESI